MNRRFFLFFLSLLALLLWSACSKSEKETLELDFGYDYFPLELGKFRVYEVDSIIFDAGAGTLIDSIRSQIREVITDTLLDGSGELAFRVERLTRRGPGDAWQIQKVLTLSRNERQAFQVEDNLRFINLVFPPSVGSNWDAHIFFDEDFEIGFGGQTLPFFKEWNSQITETGATLEIGDLSFQDVLTVSVADFENIIEIRRGSEQYARGVGLVYREIWALDTQCQFCCQGDLGGCIDLPWEMKAEKGIMLRQRLIAHN